MRTELIAGYLAQLYRSFGAAMPADHERLLALHQSGDIVGLFQQIVHHMKLPMQFRLMFVRSGGPVGRPAWIEVPSSFPSYLSTEIQVLRIPVYLRNEFVAEAPFSSLVLAISHELSHVLLDMFDHPLKQKEEAVDLTAMLCGYREFYRTGKFFITLRNDKVFADSLGYLTLEEIRFAADLLKKING